MGRSWAGRAQWALSTRWALCLGIDGAGVEGGGALVPTVLWRRAPRPVQGMQLASGEARGWTGLWTLPLSVPGHRATGWPRPSGQPSRVIDASGFGLDPEPLPWGSGCLDGENQGCLMLLPQLLHEAGPETWISIRGLARHGHPCPPSTVGLVACTPHPRLAPTRFPVSPEPLAPSRCLAGEAMEECTGGL